MRLIILVLTVWSNSGQSRTPQGSGWCLLVTQKGLFKGGRRAVDDLSRLFSRLARTKQLRKAKKADVLAIARAWGISGEAELAVMQAIAEKPGGITRSDAYA